MDSSGIPKSSHQRIQSRPKKKPFAVYHYKRKKRLLPHPIAWPFRLLTLFLFLFMGFLYCPLQPFETIRNFWVESAMTSMSHQYLAKWFFSDAKIQKILDSDQAQDLGNSDSTLINARSTNKNNSTELINISQNGFSGYLLKINNPGRVRVAVTHYLGKIGERAEDIAYETGAAAVINGGAFSDPQGNGSGGHPQGILISRGRLLYKDPGVSTYDIIGLNQRNVLVLGHYTLANVKRMGIRDAVTFGPFLVVNGKPAITHGDGAWGIAPRTAIGQTKDGTILMLVIDGRQVGSLGATLKDVQNIMLKYGAYNVANLDGGASTVLYYHGYIVNHPSSPYGERHAPSFFIVK
ncbi:hypothetical protein DEAC_c38900 [Desulfosporosinus acididurans]|uniref:Phosphodiester glycosidase domain-containing protein n=2 Tax=Desulfosporosinus acididurans TaxID=476652 RepID=A0A0J1FLL5_9FIRM|nr:hypothetical protein DEAC_c38900 [Desulfosporosinus acididurans]